jgi:hypothetical protein
MLQKTFFGDGGVNLFEKLGILHFGPSRSLSPAASL